MSAQALSGTLAYSAVGLPDGLSINSSTERDFRDRCSSAAAADGPFAPEVLVSNGNQAASASFNWTINPMVTLTTIADQSGVEGNTVSLQVTASEPGTPTFTYTASGLPSGLNINATTGLISGTISTGDSADSPYLIDVSVSDGAYSNDVSYQLSITDGSVTLPSLTAPANQVNVVGDSVNVPVSASDSDSGTLSYVASGLPDGPNEVLIRPSGLFRVRSPRTLSGNHSIYGSRLPRPDGSSGLSTTQTIFSGCVNDSKMAATAENFTASEGVDTTVTLANFTAS